MRDIVFSEEHFVALKDVVFPEGFFNGRETLHYFDYEAFLDLQDFSPGVRSDFGVIYVRDKAFKAEDLSCEHRFLVDHLVVGEFDYASSFFDEVDMFGYLRVVDNDFVGVECVLLSQFVGEHLQDGSRNVFEDIAFFILREDFEQIRLLPFRTRKIQLK